ncbi:ZIP-like iron-zinc transporter [Pholiota conissans]|uniref:ZIP-like iron-zinc transporter n=1 Tax=Pholiota conissans TaxID=109636 RepID=A0A9P5ZAC6_9AGAR|nr:ZIP-like iron-zinc transporter [Pholiota conissans]
MVVQVLVMALVLGASTFIVGMLPLLYAFSKSHLERLTALGTGLLLGAALGVIIPEGIEATVEANSGEEVPTGRIAFCLVIGFTIMLFIEQLLAPNVHSHSLEPGPIPLSKARIPDSVSSVEFDAELGDVAYENHSAEHSHVSMPSPTLDIGSSRERAFPLLLGLVIHGCADGLALGVANASKPAAGATNTVSLVVFIALILHKAPTALAFTTSILASNLPRQDCKKYLGVFCLSTPLMAIASYVLFSFFGNGDKGNLIGMALLISGGTFLYVATVLQPVSNHGPSPGTQIVFRVLLIALGMFVPLLLSSLFGHGH